MARKAISMLESYFNTSNTELLIEDLAKGSVVTLREKGHKFHKDCDNSIREKHPEEWQKLADLHGAAPEFAYARVQNFLACNFSFKDGKIDIDEHFNFNYENVPCPARVSGICKLKICFPKFTSELSKRELEVLRFFCKALSEEEIGEKLFISPHTVHNHINNIYAKLGFVGKPHPDRLLIDYAHTKRLV